MSDFCIGVDLGGTNLRIAAVASDGRLLEKVNLDTKVGVEPHHVIEEMCGAIKRLSSQYQNGGKLLGAGIGIPGIIDLEAGVVSKSANLPGWSGYPVRAEIEKRLGAPIFMENDAKVAALGEQWLGAARGVPDMAMITLGTGIGGAIVLNGKIFHGLNGMAGEYGHITVEPEGVLCGCGNRGCAERYASATAIVRMAREMIAAGEAPQLAKAAASSDPEFTSRTIYALAKQGDKPALEIFRRFGRAFGMMLADIVNVLNLEMYVVGGGVSNAWDIFSPPMFEEIRRRSIVYAATEPDSTVGKAEGASADIAVRTRRKTIITRAVLGGDSGLYGGARLALLN
jgi:glucokinase